MTDIEDSRGAAYKSWKSYALALKHELKCSQENLTENQKQACWKSVRLEIRRGRINGKLF